MIPIDQNQSQIAFDEQTQPEIAENTDVKKEGVIDRLLGSLLQNLELTVTNFAVRVLSRSRDSDDDTVPIPTIMLRVNKFDYIKATEGQHEFFQELHCLLHDKKVRVGDVSIHLMKDQWLDANEYDKPGQFNANTYKLECPFEYPLVTHPSTLLLLKGAQSALEVRFQFQTASDLNIETQFGNVEAMISIYDLVILSKAIENFKIKKKTSDEQVKTERTELSLSQSLLIESKHFKQDFVESFKADSELMKSIEDFVKLTDSQAPNQNVPMKKIKLQGEVKAELIRMAFLCHKGGEKIEDKVFKIFQQAVPSTSAEIFYEISTRNVKISFQKRPAKNLFTSLFAPQFLIKSYLRGSMEVNQTLDYSQNINSEDLFHSLVNSSLDKSVAIEKEKFELLDDSTVFLDANQNEVIEPQPAPKKENPIKVIELQPAPLYNYFSETLLEIQDIDAMLRTDQVKFQVSKVFLYVTSTDLVMLLHILQLLGQKETKPDQVPNQKSSKTIKIDGQIQGVEVQLYMHRVNSYTVLKASELPIPEELALNKSAIGLSFQLKIHQNDDGPVISLTEVDIMSIHKNRKITLLSIDEVQVAQTSILKQQNTLQTSSNSQDIEDGYDDDDVSPIRFIKNSSSNISDGPKLPSEEFQLENASSCLKVRLSGIDIDIEGRDFDELSDFIIQQELALKHTSNILDIFSLASTLKPRPAKLPTTQLAIQVHNFKLLLSASSKTRPHVPRKPLIEFNIGLVELGLRLGGSREISCIEVKAKVNQILLLDLLSEEIEVYNPMKDEFSQLSSSQLSTVKGGDQYLDKLLSGRSILHESKPTLAMIAIDCQICFVEEGSLQSRADLSFVQTESIQQLYADLGEMKVNPMQLKIFATLKNFSTDFTNQTLRLGQQLQKQITSKLLNRLQYVRKDQQVNFIPRLKSQVDVAKQYTYIDLKVDNFTCSYQPTMKLTQFQTTLGRAVDKTWNGQNNDQLFRSPHIAVIRINSTALTTNTIDHHSLQAGQIQVLFLSEKTPTNLDDLVNYSESGDRLNELGFVQVLDLSNLKAILKHSHVKISIQSLRVGMCSDLLSEILVVQRIIIASFTDVQPDDLTQTTFYPVQKLQPELQIPLNDSQEEFKSVEDLQQIQSLTEEENVVLVVGGINQSPKWLQIDQKGSSTVKSETLDITNFIDSDYFKDTSSINNRKLVHKRPECFGQPKLEISFEIGTIKLILYSGADFDFKLGPVRSSTFQNGLDQSLTRSAASLSNSQSQHASRQVREPSYVTKTSQGGLGIEVLRQSSQNTRRARITQRDAKKSFQISFSEICVSLRVFSEKNNDTKTLALSIGNAQISLQKDMNSELQMLESPYCYRLRNLIELTCILEADKQNDSVEELQLVLSLRPTKIMVRHAPIDFVGEYLSCLSKSTGQSQQQPVADNQSKVTHSKKVLRVKSLVVKESEIQISVKQLHNFTLGTLINFDGFTFVIKHFQLVASVKEPLLLDDALAKVLSNYWAEAKRWDNMYRLLSSYKPFRSIGKGVYNIFAPIYKPLIGVRYGGVGVFNGLSEGLQDLTGYLQEESYGWTMYLIRKIY